MNAFFKWLKLAAETLAGVLFGIPPLGDDQRRRRGLWRQARRSRLQRDAQASGRSRNEESEKAPN